MPAGHFPPLNLADFSMYNLYMPNNFKKTHTLYSIHLPILIAIFALIAGGSYLITNRPAGTGETPQVQGKKTEKNTAAVKNSRSVKNDVDVFAETAAVEHKKVVGKVVKEIKRVAETEEAGGNDEVGEELTSIAEEQEETTDETAEAIEEVVNEPKWKIFLIGTDYKNLGQLRSTLAKNTNTIRKLTSTVEKLTSEGGDETIQANLDLLNAEREKIISVIKASESQFSLLGWVSKLLAGYTSVPVDDGTEGTGESAPVGGTEGTGDTSPSSTDTTGTGTTEPGSAEGQAPESAAGTQIIIE